jgi:hypothetical protein
MEPPDEIQALKLRPGQIGLIKEGPVARWLKGQEAWDRRYKRDAERAIMKRSQIEVKAKRLLDDACAQGLIHPDIPSQDRCSSRRSAALLDQTDGIQQDRRWGPLDLEGERPPPAAIAKRRDTVSRMCRFEHRLIDANAINSPKPLLFSRKAYTTLHQSPIRQCQSCRFQVPGDHRDSLHRNSRLNLHT